MIETAYRYALFIGGYTLVSVLVFLACLVLVGWLSGPREDGLDEEEEQQKRHPDWPVV